MLMLIQNYVSVCCKKTEYHHTIGVHLKKYGNGIGVREKRE